MEALASYSIERKVFVKNEEEIIREVYEEILDDTDKEIKI